MLRNHLYIVDNDLAQKLEILLPHTSCKVGLCKLFSYIIHHKLKSGIRKLNVLQLF